MVVLRPQSRSSRPVVRDPRVPIATMLYQLLAVLLCAGLASAGCPTNVEWQEFDGFCYWRSTYATSWQQAVIACPTVGVGSQLASIHSLLENAFIMQTYDFAETWIGFNDIAQEGQFQWSDGTQVDFFNWARQQPDNQFGQDCTRVPQPDNPHAAEWDDTACDKEHFFVCKMPATV
ncbi:lectin BRA-3-like [Amphibalanus amphitrite]|uniref:lectin BRA-3-like n=1 Tax=Amphibalanus amphitrite TaxID=1232801 RepID=UPI001C910EDF|nr:lectin BRA-3-like [Amphibalanus amphitrite]